MKVLKIGVAGAGVMGRNHARVLTDIRDVNLTHVFDPDAVVAQGVAEAYGASPVTSADYAVDAFLKDRLRTAHKDLSNFVNHMQKLFYNPLRLPHIVQMIYGYSP